MSNAITVTIQAVAPLVGSVTETVSLNQRVRELKISAMGRIGESPSLADQYTLVFQDLPLPEDKTLIEVGVSHGATLRLAPVTPEIPEKPATM